MAEIQTGDLYRTAYLLCAGGNLTETLRDHFDHVEFVVTGTEILEADGNYRRGEALVDPLQLKENINILRDKIFRDNRDQRRDGRRHHGKVRTNRY